MRFHIQPIEEGGQNIEADDLSKKEADKLNDRKRKSLHWAFIIFLWFGVCFFMLLVIIWLSYHVIPYVRNQLIPEEQFHSIEKILTLLVGGISGIFFSNKSILLNLIYKPRDKDFYNP